jgi:hypothetical protein
VALPRIGLVERAPLWADEAFSLAMATGHSLEHPAEVADPARGDYVEAPRALPASEYRRYLEHEDPPAGPGRVLRAVMLSDTNPPLYYLLLYGWTRALGTGDAALRLFSTFWALACFPLLWSLARRVGGPAAAVPTCVLFYATPIGLDYSLEGRMYSLVWFLALGNAWAALALHRRGCRAHLLALWVATGAAGLLTHYFYLFVWAASAGWLALRPGALPRRVAWLGILLTSLLVLPWYGLALPRSLASWHVTDGWLYLPPRQGPLQDLRDLLLSYFAGGVYRWYGASWAQGFAYLLVVGLVGSLAWRMGRRAVEGPLGLVWLWLIAALGGLQLFDLLLGTHATSQTRYAAAGLPAAMLLAGAALGGLGSRVRVVGLALILVAWLSGMSGILLNRNYWEPFREAARLVDGGAERGDVVIVHSTPSGVLGLARYMGGDTPIASWVGPLQQRRVPDDVERLTDGYRRVVFVWLHAVGETAPEEAWLRGNATIASEQSIGDGRIVYFLPRSGGRFGDAS